MTREGHNAPLTVARSDTTLKRLRMTALILAAMGSAGVSGFALGDTTAASIVPRSDIDIRIGRNAQSGRIEIYGSIGSRASVRREGNQVVIRLPGAGKPDLGDIRSNPPIGVTSVDLKSDTRASELWLNVNEGYESHFGREEGAVFVQIDPKKIDNAPQDNGKKDGLISVNLQDMLKAQSADVPAKGAAQRVVLPVVQVSVASALGGRDLTFPFSGPIASAVFRRGDSVWIVFDSEVDLRLPPELKDGMIVTDAQWTHNDGFTAVRITAPAIGGLSAISDGATWKVRLGGKPLDNKATEANIIRDDSAGVPALNINLAGATRIAWIRDPAVGDRMAVVPARGPVKNVRSTRTMLEATVGTTAQGVAVVHIAPDVKVAVDGDLVGISRPHGLTLSAYDPDAHPDDNRLEYKNALYPSLMNSDWSKTPAEGFLPRYTALQMAAADESQLGAGAPTKARLALARFLIGQNLSFEAQGVLDLLTRQSPNSLNDPQVRGTRVLARMLANRYADAAGDLSSAQLVSDPAAHLWSGYAETKSGHYADAVKDFQIGLKAMDQFPTEWRSKLASAYAYSALQTKDLTTAQTLIKYAVTQPSTALDKLSAYLVDAQIIEATGDKVRALNVFKACARASDDSIAAPAAMHVAMLSYDLQDTDANKTLAQLDALRFRWRGDGAELKIIDNMGQIYLSQGRYREALQVLRSGDSYGADPQAIQIQASLNQAFRGLFLGGMADGLQPVEALGLFRDFQSLTPQGADGDQMVRRIVRRLVDVDLLDDAAQLLDYQINNRLDGVAKSSVAADLAAIYLMDHDPQKALQTLWATRTTLLPKAVMSERAVLEARALTELNQPDKALEALGRDASADSDDVRVDIYWRQQDWAKAAAVLEKQLGVSYKADTPLSLVDESRLIRAGVAYSLLKDQKSLSRLSDRFGKFIATASSADALRVALAPLDGGAVNARDFALAAAQTDSFAGWVSGMKKRFREKDNAAGKAAATTPPAKTA